jgi:hypothetical protein
MQAQRRSIGTQTEPEENVKKPAEEIQVHLPDCIKGKAVCIVDLFDCEIRRDGLNEMFKFLINDLPIKIKILKDELYISLIKANQQHLKKEMSLKLSQYLDNKLGNIIKDLQADNRISHQQYVQWMRAMKGACGLTCFV